MEVQPNPTATYFCIAVSQLQQLGMGNRHYSNTNHDDDAGEDDMTVVDNGRSHGILLYGM